MNKYYYEKYVVSKKNCWEKGLIINNYVLNMCKDNNILNWNMKRVEYNYYNTYMENYYIGYSLLPYDNFKYLQYKKSKNCNWINYDWLPFWGKLTEKKSELLKEIKFFWVNKILQKFNVNENLIIIIKEKLKKKI